MLGSRIKSTFFDAIRLSQSKVKFPEIWSCSHCRYNNNKRMLSIISFEDLNLQQTKIAVNSRIIHSSRFLKARQ